MTLNELRVLLEEAKGCLLRLHGRLPDFTPDEVAYCTREAAGLLAKALAILNKVPR